MRQLASIVDVNNSIISKVENGYRIPTKEQVEKMAKALESYGFKLLKNIWCAEKFIKKLRVKKCDQNTKYS